MTRDADPLDRNAVGEVASALHCAAYDRSVQAFRGCVHSVCQPSTREFSCPTEPRPPRCRSRVAAPSPSTSPSSLIPMLVLVRNLSPGDRVRWYGLDLVVDSIRVHPISGAVSMSAGGRQFAFDWDMEIERIDDV